jgi:hypothetical protein
MAEPPQPVDLWSVLDEAEHTVEHWPAWQQAYEADVYGELYETNDCVAGGSGRLGGHRG